MKEEKILVIWSSLYQKERSYSYKLAEAFLNEYINLHKDKNIKYEWIDLEEEKIANISLTKKILHNHIPDYTDKFWKLGDKYITKLKEVDKVIFACPKINFSYPASCKNFFDSIVIPGKTFSYKNRTKESDKTGLIENLKVQVLITQGSPEKWYPWGNIAKPLEWVWKFIGAEVSESYILGATKLEGLDPKGLIEKYHNSLLKAVRAF